MSFSIQGKTAIITGAANGIGLAIAKHFAQNGANVMMADIDEEKLENETNLLSKEFPQTKSFTGDLRQRLCLANLLSATIDELKGLPYNGNGMTVGEKITEQSGLIGEKIDISGLEVIEATKVVAYNHPGNQLATLVALNSESEIAEDAGKQVAMQVAAMNPLAVNKDGIDSKTIEKEIEVGKDQAIQEGKPAEMAEKIALGRLNKFFKENTLLSQQFVRDNKFTVEQFLNNSEKGLTISAFKRFSLS